VRGARKVLSVLLALEIDMEMWCVGVGGSGPEYVVL
jgi:hypothetical protein